MLPIVFLSVEHVGRNSNCSRYFVKYKPNKLIDDPERDVHLEMLLINHDADQVVKLNGRPIL